MDIEMPVMDGLTALRQLMKEYPLPVVMFSIITQEGAEKTITAIELGAVDFMTKPSGNNLHEWKENQEMVVNAIQSGTKGFIVKPFSADRIEEALAKVLN